MHCVISISPFLQASHFFTFIFINWAKKEVIFMKFAVLHATLCFWCFSWGDQCKREVTWQQLDCLDQNALRHLQLCQIQWGSSSSSSSSPMLLSFATSPRVPSPWMSQTTIHGIGATGSLEVGFRQMCAVDTVHRLPWWVGIYSNEQSAMSRSSFSRAAETLGFRYQTGTGFIPETVRSNLAGCLLPFLPLLIIELWAHGGIRKKMWVHSGKELRAHSM